MSIDKETILQYDIESLKNNISKLGKDIVLFEEIAEKSKEQNQLEQVEAFTKAIEDAKTERQQLEEYVALIEGERSGNQL